MSRTSKEHRVSCELEKRLLFAVEKGVWEDAEGTVVAREEKGSVSSWGADRLLARRGSGPKGEGKVLEVTNAAAKDVEKRDLVVACWVMQMWMAEGVRWEGDMQE